jgi:hypothetical protein
VVSNYQQNKSIMKGIFYIEKLGEPMEVQSQKVEGGKLAKRMVILREMGERNADCVVAHLLGPQAQNGALKEEDIVIASVKLSVHEHNGNIYQDAVVGVAHILCPANL